MADTERRKRNSKELVVWVPKILGTVGIKVRTAAVRAIEGRWQLLFLGSYIYFPGQRGNLLCECAAAWSSG